MIGPGDRGAPGLWRALLSDVDLGGPRRYTHTHTVGEKAYGSQMPPLAVVRLGWTGELPDGVEAIQVRSRYVFVVPHIAVYGDDDLVNVHGLHSGLKLFDVDGFASGVEIAPGPPMRPARRPDTTTPSELMFFEELCEILKDLTIRKDEAGFVCGDGVGVGSRP